MDLRVLLGCRSGCDTGVWLSLILLDVFPPVRGKSICLPNRNHPVNSLLSCGEKCCPSLSTAAELTQGTAGWGSSSSRHQEVISLCVPEKAMHILEGRCVYFLSAGHKCLLFVMKPQEKNHCGLDLKHSRINNLTIELWKQTPVPFLALGYFRATNNSYFFCNVPKEFQQLQKTYKKLQ